MYNNTQDVIANSPAISAPTHHKSPVWRIGCFALNNTAANIYYMVMLYISYWAGGVLGIAVMLVSGILMAMSLLDTIIDPVVGWLMDKTNGRFGKFRPFMLLGNLVMILGLILIYFTRDIGGDGSDQLKILIFIICYFVYIVGYTAQFCVTRAAQSVLTNDPKQRPVFTVFDMIYNVILYVAVSMVVSNYLVPKYDGFTTQMFGELFIITALAALFCTVLAIIGIWPKDKPKYFGLDETKHSDREKLKWKDYADVIVHNKAVLPLLIASGIDKLASNIATNNAVIGVIIYGIICGNYALYGELNMFVFGPSIVISLACVQFARKLGQKSAFKLGTIGALICTLGILSLFVFGDPTSLSFETWSLFTILMLVFMAVRGGFMSITNSILVPMIGDVTDSEVARTGRYVPGLIGAIFSFADKLMTSLNNVVVGFMLVLIGFSTAYPNEHTANSPELFAVGMIALCGLPILSWVVNLICLKVYPLSKEKMVEIQDTVQKLKAEA